LALEVGAASKVKIGFGLRKNTWIFEQLHGSKYHYPGRDEHVFLPYRRAG